MQQISFHDLSKAYAGAPALSGVSLHLRAGQVHALMGENGAGKSTLIKLIAGVVSADSLQLTIDGAPAPLASPADATAAGFRFIHQELNIVPQVSVAENILLGHALPRRFGLAVDWTRLRARARAALDELGAAHIDVRAPAGSLPTGDRMLVRIASALVAEAGPEPVLYVFDEPTAALTEAEAERIFAVIARLTERGAAVLYVSHHLGEVLRLSDVVTVLRDGAQVWTRPIAECSREALIEAMTGRDLAHAFPPRIGPMGDEVRARLEGAASRHLSGLNVALRAGEILGVAGLAGAGQSEVLRLLLGDEPLRAGEAELEGQPLPRNPAQAWGRGVAYVPRERRGEGLMLDMGARANAVLPRLAAYGALARPRTERREAGEVAGRVRLKAAGLDQPVRELSGGNQQKVVFARALLAAPRLLLLDEPTRGVDIGARYDIHALMRGLAAQGCAMVLSSSDLPELLGMSDRILILHAGRQAHLVARGALTSAELLHLFHPAEAA